MAIVLHSALFTLHVIRLCRSQALGQFWPASGLPAQYKGVSQVRRDPGGIKKAPKSDFAQGSFMPVPCPKMPDWAYKIISSQFAGPSCTYNIAPVRYCHMCTVFLHCNSSHRHFPLHKAPRPPCPLPAYNQFYGSAVMSATTNDFACLLTILLNY